MANFTTCASVTCVMMPPAHAAARVEEPVHEDALAVVVGVVGQQAVPLVLLLARTVTLASQGGRFPEVGEVKVVRQEPTCRSPGGWPARTPCC